jgi:hypothetical protein
VGGPAGDKARPHVGYDNNTQQPQAKSSRTPRQQARSHISRGLAPVNQYALTYLFDQDGFYEKLADKLIDKVPLRRRWQKGHWLCLRLLDTAKMFDPDEYAELAGATVRDGMVALRVPRFIASVLGAGSGVGLKMAFGTTPLGNLTKTIKVLISLVCPDLSSCPTEREVLKTFASPGLGQVLHNMASG